MNLSKKNRSLLFQSPLFDPEWYLQRYPDAARSKLCALDHFLYLGIPERREPSKSFDVSYYVETYGAEIEGGAHPFLHYLFTGRAKGYLPNSSARPIALIAHVFHLDVLDDLRLHSDNFPNYADVFVTHPDTFREPQLRRIRDVFPRANYVPVANIGQDVGAMVALSKQIDLCQYEAICKIHTKKGALSSERWRKGLLRGVLPDADGVGDIIDSFRANEKILLCGPKQLYLHGPTYVLENADSLANDFPNILGSFDFMAEDWGFFAGTMFWARSTMLKRVIDSISEVLLSRAGYALDGMPAHAVERMFGMAATLDRGLVRLVDCEEPFAQSTIGYGYPEDFERNPIWILDLLNEIQFCERLPALPVQGNMRIQQFPIGITGWIAGRRDKMYLRVKDWEVEVVPDRDTSDHADENLPDNARGFAVPVPPEFVNGEEYIVELLLGEKRRAFVECKARWFPSVRTYRDFKEFLASTMTLPVINAPFADEDRQMFGVMHGIAAQLAPRGNQTRHRISVICIVNDDLHKMRRALNSVMTQTKPPFEVIIPVSTDQMIAASTLDVDHTVRWCEVSCGATVFERLNAALEAACGDLVAYIDADHVWEPNFLSVASGSFDTLPEANLISIGGYLEATEDESVLAVIYGHSNRSLMENRPFLTLPFIVHRKKVTEPLASFYTSTGGRIDDGIAPGAVHDFILRLSEENPIWSIPALLLRRKISWRNRVALFSPQKQARSNPVWAQRLQARQRSAENGQSSFQRPFEVIIAHRLSKEVAVACLTALKREIGEVAASITVIGSGEDEKFVSYITDLARTGDVENVLLEAEEKMSDAWLRVVRSRVKCADVLLMDSSAIIQPRSISALQNVAYSFPQAGMTVGQQVLIENSEAKMEHVPFANMSRPCDVTLSAFRANVDTPPVFHNGGPLQLKEARFFCSYLRLDAASMIMDFVPVDNSIENIHLSLIEMMHLISNYRLLYVPDAKAVQRSDAPFKDIFDR